MADVSSIPDDELVRRVLKHLTSRGKGRRPQPLWYVVMEHFLLGSTYASQLCARFGHDPDMPVRP